MRRRFLQMTGVLVLLFSPARLGAADELRLEATLQEMSVQQFACGGYKLGVVMKYEVDVLLEGNYEGKEIYVVHYCPEIPRAKFSADAGTLEKFQVGDKHQMVLRPWDTAQADVFDDFAETDRVIYECVTVYPAV